MKRIKSGLTLVCALALLCPALAAADGGGGNGYGKGKRKRGSGKVLAPSKAPPRLKLRGAASPNAVRAKTSADLMYGEPIRYHNLSLVPVGTTLKGPFQQYQLLEEGLKARTLTVREMNGKSGEAQVPAVEVRNKGREPVYLLGGEMILGGKQDRIISADTVVSANGRWTKVKVFCVEQGRWRGQNMKFRGGGALAHVSLRKAAMSGSQGKVWEEVARKNIKHGTQSSTSTYRRTIQNAALRRKIAPYRRSIVGKLPAGLRLAGMVFAINGKIRVVDIMGNPLLYAKLQEKLVSSYVLEALGQQVVRNAPSISKGAAQQYIHKARKAKRMNFKGSGRSRNNKIDNADLIGNETFDKKTGKRVRESYITK
jgi:ARG and Rhodanese-Phosphatase-superfamily-associated Protein domain